MLGISRLHNVVAMLEQSLFAQNDIAALRTLIDDYAWVTLATATPGEVTVSHFPVILDPDRNDLTVLGHLATEDAHRHEIGSHPAVIIVQGPHGYVSPAWYEAGPYVPTWNFVIAHLHGTPEVLGPADTFDVLDRTCAHFEAKRTTPWRLDSVHDYATRLAPHTTGCRLTPDRVVGKAKLSQDKPRAIADRVISALEDRDQAFANPILAAAMRAVIGA